MNLDVKSMIRKLFEPIFAFEGLQNYPALRSESYVSSSFIGLKLETHTSLYLVMVVSCHVRLWVELIQ
jgi:hypothetical protein